METLGSSGENAFDDSNTFDDGNASDDAFTMVRVIVSWNALGAAVSVVLLFIGSLSLSLSQASRLANGRRWAVGP